MRAQLCLPRDSNADRGTGRGWCAVAARAAHKLRDSLCMAAACWQRGLAARWRARWRMQSQSNQSWWAGRGGGTTAMPLVRGCACATGCSVLTAGGAVWSMQAWPHSCWLHVAPRTLASTTHTHTHTSCWHTRAATHLLTRVTLWPLLARSDATTMPAKPPPITSTFGGDAMAALACDG